MGDSSVILNNTHILETLNWIDKHTSALFVEFTLFNPNVNLFQYCSILFEILPSGNFVNSAQFSSIDLTEVNNSGLLYFKICMYIIYMAFIAIFMIVEIRKLAQLGSNYFFQFNNYIELIIIAFSWAAFSMYIYRLFAAFGIYKQISKHSANGLQSDFVNLQYTVSCDQFLSYFLGLCAAFSTFRFINLLRFSKQIIVFLIAFRKSLKELISVCFMCFILWLSFVQVIYLMMDNQSIQFYSLISTMATCFQIILGKFSADTFFDSQTFLSPFLFVAYNVCIVFVMLNLCVSILVKNYLLARSDHDLDDQDPELFNYLKFSLSSALCCLKVNKESTRPIYLDYIETLPSKFEACVERVQKVLYF